MVISKFAFRIAALAAIIGAPIWQPVRAEETATQRTSDSASCPRSTFRVVIDVGHTATSPGADSARGVHEYEFNLDLAEAIVQSLREAQFDRTVRLITSGARLSSLFHRVASAKHLQADLFLSIHHDSVPDHLKETLVGSLQRVLPEDDDEVDEIGSLSQSAEALRITAAAPVRSTSVGGDYEG